MKNERIRRAIDTVSPTADQKRRMRRELEEKLEEKRGARLHTARYARPKRLSWLDGAAAVLVLAAGLALGLSVLQPAEVPPLTASTQPSAPSVEQNPADGEEEALAVYRDVLDIYLNAINTDWDGALCAEADISLLVRDVPTTSHLGYALEDLDGDGDCELLVTDGNVIYDLYARSDGGQICHLLTGWERNAYFLSEDGMIVNYGSNSASSSVVYFYRIQGTQLIKIEALAEDYVDPDAPWFREDVSTGKRTPMTEGEYNAAVERYPKRPIAYTPLSALER